VFYPHYQLEQAGLINGRTVYKACARALCLFEAASLVVIGGIVRD
jgi:hypothetical protein